VKGAGECREVKLKKRDARNITKVAAYLGLVVRVRGRCETVRGERARWCRSVRVEYEVLKLVPCPGANWTLAALSHKGRDGPQRTWEGVR